MNVSHSPHRCATQMSHTDARMQILRVADKEAKGCPSSRNHANAHAILKRFAAINLVTPLRKLFLAVTTFFIRSGSSKAFFCSQSRANRSSISSPVRVARRSTMTSLTGISALSSCFDSNSVIAS